MLARAVVELLRSPETTKILTTVDDSGIPHTVFKDSLTALDDGTIAYAEMLESSQSNRNMVKSIWFGRKVNVTVSGKDRRSYQICCRPVRCVTGGSLFKDFLKQVKNTLGAEGDLQAVWVLAPENVRDESLQVRVREEEEKRPFLNKRLGRFT